MDLDNGGLLLSCRVAFPFLLVLSFYHPMIALLALYHTTVHRPPLCAVRLPYTHPRPFPYAPRSSGLLRRIGAERLGAARRRAVGPEEVLNHRSRREYLNICGITLPPMAPSRTCRLSPSSLPPSLSALSVLAVDRQRSHPMPFSPAVFLQRPRGGEWRGVVRFGWAGRGGGGRGGAGRRGGGADCQHKLGYEVWVLAKS